MRQRPGVIELWAWVCRGIEFLGIEYLGDGNSGDGNSGDGNSGGGNSGDWCVHRRYWYFSRCRH